MWRGWDQRSREIDRSTSPFRVRDLLLAAGTQLRGAAPATHGDHVLRTCFLETGTNSPKKKSRKRITRYFLEIYLRWRAFPWLF